MSMYADGDMKHIAKVTLPGAGGPEVSFSSSNYFRDASVEIEINGMKGLVLRTDLVALTRVFPAPREATDPISEDAAKTLRQLREMLGLTRHHIE